jgi:outer membrane protein OmpA-like peptidoglycan-associated protein
VGGTIGNPFGQAAKEAGRRGRRAKRTDEGILVNMSGDILFDTGKATLKADACNS